MKDKEENQLEEIEMFKAENPYDPSKSYTCCDQSSDIRGFDPGP